MKLRVRTFGVTRDILGGQFIEIEVGGRQVADLRQALLAKHAGLKALNSLLIAVNQNYAEDSLELNETDEIALIPPVSGG